MKKDLDPLWGKYINLDITVQSSGVERIEMVFLKYPWWIFIFL